MAARAQPDPLAAQRRRATVVGRAAIGRTVVGRTAIGRARGRHRTLLLATCVALVAAAVADEATGYDGPGPFVYPVFALAVALVPWRYTPLLATVMSVFFTAGALASRVFTHVLVTPGHVLDFTAGWAQLLSFAAAALLATAAVMRAPRTAASPAAPGRSSRP